MRGADALVRLCGHTEKADVGVGRGPGGPPHESSQAAKKLMDSSTA
jgi:hypothetical protein